MKIALKLLIVFVLLVVATSIWSQFGTKSRMQATTFEECVAAGNPVMESYPRQCRDGAQTFVENVGNEVEKADLIRLANPRPNQTIESPLTITGEARGNWFFEGDFPVMLTDWDGRIIAEGYATAQGEWMTTEFVPFEAELSFVVDPQVYSHRGTLILQKDNPSGLPEHDDALEIPVMFAKTADAAPVACTLDAKICPDGSAVGRVGPKCEFAACPSGGSSGILPFDSGVSGTVLVGPTCPVVRNPPDPGCADKPYPTTVQVFAVGSHSNSPFSVVDTDKEGKYTVALPPGEYNLQPVGGKPLPSCSSTQVTIQPSVMLSVDLSCDSGIR